jgi:hypothetical protein
MKPFIEVVRHPGGTASFVGNPAEDKSTAVYAQPNAGKDR